MHSLENIYGRLLQFRKCGVKLARVPDLFFRPRPMPVPLLNSIKTAGSRPWPVPALSSSRPERVDLILASLGPVSLCFLSSPSHEHPPQ
jgi:hypothetical protein